MMMNEANERWHINKSVDAGKYVEFIFYIPFEWHEMKRNEVKQSDGERERKRKKATDFVTILFYRMGKETVAIQILPG